MGCRKKKISPVFSVAHTDPVHSGVTHEVIPVVILRNSVARKRSEDTASKSGTLIQLLRAELGRIRGL